MSNPIGGGGSSTWRAWAVIATLLVAACGGEPYGDPVRFTVPAGAGMSQIADTLAAHDIIERPTLFRLYARYRKVARNIKPGMYELRRGTGWDDALDALVRGDVVRVTVVVPEGWGAAQIAERIAAVTGAPVDSVVDLVLGDSAAARFRVPGPTLEGYLYPATYVFPSGTTPDAILERMVARYREAWTPELRARADSVGLSEREVVTLASIIEKEAKRWVERDTIAAVYRNRLRIGMKLDADPTVQYALGEHQQRLLYAHIDSVADNPYNTYRHRGLPPGPIGSPSQDALRAALYPADVGYLYFVALPDGRHVFSRTLDQHNAARRRIAQLRRDAATAAEASPDTR